MPTLSARRGEREGGQDPVKACRAEYTCTVPGATAGRACGRGAACRPGRALGRGVDEQRASLRCTRKWATKASGEWRSRGRPQVPQGGERSRQGRAQVLAALQLRARSAGGRRPAGADRPPPQMPGYSVAQQLQRRSTRWPPRRLELASGTPWPRHRAPSADRARLLEAARDGLAYEVRGVRHREEDLAPSRRRHGTRIRAKARGALWEHRVNRESVRCGRGIRGIFTAAGSVWGR